MTQQSYHQENLREKLIEAGIKIMNQQGYEALSLRKIAAACQVSHSAPYRHFENKEELLAAMQQYVEQRFLTILQEATVKGKDERCPMIPFGKAYVTFFAEHPEYYSFFTSQEGIYVHFDDDFNQIKSNYQPFLLFKEQAASHFKVLDLPQRQYTPVLMRMWAGVHGLAGIVTLPGTQYEGSWEEMTEKVLKGVSFSE